MKRTLPKLLFTALLIFCSCAAAEISVHFMDIDRNDGILIECDGEYAFFDAGTYEYAARAIDYMREQNVPQLKYYVGTHAHNDHVGAGSAILANIGADAVLVTHDDTRRMIASRAKTEEEKASCASTEIVTVVPGDVYTIGGAELHVLGPLHLRDNKKSHEYENENSLVCMLTYGDVRILLTGDAPGTVLREIDKQTPGVLHCDLLKNPHHNGPLEEDVIAAIGADYVLYSTADDFLPTGPALRVATESGAIVLITAPSQNGNVVVHSDGTSFEIGLQHTPESLVLPMEELTLRRGQKKSIRAEIVPTKFKAVTYRSGNPEIATVDFKGAVTAKAEGTVTITAEAAGGLSASCTVTVKP